MYEDPMNRPMFQTPQMRQGGGIMAGVAPIRGYAEGDLVSDDEVVAAGTEEEIADKLFGPGGLLFDTDAPVQSTLMALTVPLGAGVLGITARGLIAARRMSQVAKAADKADDIRGTYPYVPVTPSSTAASGGKSVASRVASAVKENPKKAAAGAGIAALAVTPQETAVEETQATPAADKQPPPTQPEPVVTKTGGSDNEETQAPQTFMDMLKGAGTQFKDFLQDPANRYALAKAGQASEGITPRYFASDFALGKEEYEQIQQQRDLAERKMLQEERGGAFEQQLKIIQDVAGVSPKEAINMLLSQDASGKELLSLFVRAKADAADMIESSQEGLMGSMTAAEIDAMATSMARATLQGGSAGSSGATGESGTTALSKEEAEKLAEG